MDLNSIVEGLKTALSNNEFFQGGVYVAIMSGVWYYLRSVPGIIWERVKILCTDHIEITVTPQSSREEHKRFVLFEKLITEHFKNFSLNKINLTEEDSSLGFGSFYGFWNRIPCQIHLTKEKEAGALERWSSGAQVTKTASIQILKIGSGKFLKTLEEKFSSLKTAKRENYEFHINLGYVGSIDKKEYFLSQTHKSVIDDLKKFIKNQGVYNKLGVSHKRGYLLSGPPGTGKSTLLKAMMQFFETVTFIDLSRIDSDSELINIFRTEGLVVIEDIDSFLDGRKVEGKWTFSGLLNAIDGVIEQENRVIAITTNDISKLDPALIRRGRVDKHFVVDYNENSLKEILAHYGHLERFEEFKGLPLCDVYSRLLDLEIRE